MSTTTRKPRHEKQRTNSLEGRVRHPYILRPALKCAVAEESASNASSDVCAQCRPILSRYADTFNTMVHQGTALKKRKHTNPNPKLTDSIPYRDVKQQNDWLQSNVFDTMGNYIVLVLLCLHLRCSWYIKEKISSSKANQAATITASYSGDV